MVVVAQLVRVPGCGPGGRGFDSHQPPHLTNLRKASGFAYFHIGASSSGKTTDFDSVIRWFESSRPSQKKSSPYGLLFAFLFNLFNNFA